MGEKLQKLKDKSQKLEKHQRAVKIRRTDTIAEGNSKTGTPNSRVGKEEYDAEVLVQCE